MKRSSIRYKLMRFTTIVAAVLLLVTSFFFLGFELLSYRQATTKQLSTLSKVIALNSTAAVAFNSPEEAQEILSAVQADNLIEFACIYDNKGEIFSWFPSSLDKSSIVFPPMEDSLALHFDFFAMKTPVRQGGKTLGMLFIKRKTADLKQTIYLYIVVAGIVIVFSFVLAFVISATLQEKISGPIIALASVSRKISTEHDYSVRATTMTDDEIGVLTKAFNDMLSQIEIQNRQLDQARVLAQEYAHKLEIEVNERTIEYRRQKEFAETVVDSSLVLIAVFDLDLRLLAFNRKCEEEFGLNRQDVLGRKYEEVMPAIKDSVTWHSVNKALSGEFVHNAQYQSPVTGAFYESYVIPLRNENGEIYAALLTAHNITALVEAGEKLKEINTELNQKNSELEQFAYVASHDLQEPLRKIQTFSEMLWRNRSDEQQIEKYVGKIDQSAVRMSTLIKDVLEYSRLSHTADSFAPIQLNEIVEQVTSDFELLINQRKATVETNNLPAIVGHRLQIHQLFANLINNAIKFNENEPRIRITGKQLVTSQIEPFPGFDPGLNYVEISFSDNGIGFDPKFADKVFTIFQRLITRDRYEGTGIGLALCKRIVENHRGNISVNSEPGKGTTFFVVLPGVG